jgi:hypothetical protein
MRTINKTMLESLNPCKDRFDNYLEHYSDFNGSFKDFLDLDKISESDKIWVFLKISSQNQLEFFAWDCAFQAAAYDAAAAYAAAYDAAAADAAAYAAAAYAADAAAYAAAYATYAADAAAYAAAAAAYAADAAAYAADAADAAYAADAAAYAAAAAAATAARVEEIKRQIHTIKFILKNVK